jgi:hypothetical protein
MDLFISVVGIASAGALGYFSARFTDSTLKGLIIIAIASVWTLTWEVR